MYPFSAREEGPSESAPRGPRYGEGGGAEPSPRRAVRRLAYSRRATAPVTAPQPPSTSPPGASAREFEMRAGVTVLIQDAEGVS